jgi:hypothetical protein
LHPLGSGIIFARQQRHLLKIGRAPCRCAEVGLDEKPRVASIRMVSIRTDSHRFASIRVVSIRIVSTAIRVASTASNAAASSLVVSMEGPATEIVGLSRSSVELVSSPRLW